MNTQVRPWMIFQTATTGLVNFKDGIEHPSQPHPVHVGIVLLDPETGEQIDAHDLLVSPDGWEIPAETIAVHGVTEERARRHGMPESLVAEEFQRIANGCVGWASYGYDFHLRVMRSALVRAGQAVEDVNAFAYARPRHCVMRDCADIVRIAPSGPMSAAGRFRAKTPKLTEAMQYFFHEEHPAVHDAMVDARAVARIWQAMLTPQPAQAS